MKRYTLILVLFSSISCFSQYCYIADPTITNLKSATVSYIPGSPIKYLRVIIHFIQKDDGSGNFNETNDGMTPSHSFTGYDYASYIVDYANSLLMANQPMRATLNGSVPVYDPGYRYILSGVFFWRDSYLYSYKYALSNLMTSFGKSKNDAINIFISSEQGNRGGYAQYVGDNSVLIFPPYRNYIASVTNNNGWYNEASALLINHEVGHCLELYHTVWTPNTAECCPYCDDYCADTPSIPQMLSAGKPSPCCWNGETCSNNLMDYNADQRSITPDQLNRVHSALNNRKLNFTECNYFTNALNISAFGNTSNSYIARNIIVSGLSAVISNGQTIYLKGNEIVLNPGFEVQLGGNLNLLTNPACN
jgi:hypothetical protein